MRLSARALTNFCSVNMFTYVNQWTIRAGEPNLLYFQLVDLDQNSLRYIPSVGATVTVKFPSINDAAIINAVATQNSSDGSIWSVSLNQTQTPFSGNVVFMVTEGGVTRSFSALSLLSVEYPGNNGSC